MPYCRECGTQVADFARFCPLCGVSQASAVVVQTLIQTPAQRNVGALVVLAFGYTLIGWMGSMFLGGFLIGFTYSHDPDVASGLTDSFINVASLPLLLVIGVLVGGLTALGVLPGTRKK